MNCSFFSNCEKEFLINSITGGIRLDGTKPSERQKLFYCLFIDRNTVCIMIANSLVQCHGSYVIQNPPNANERNVNFKAQISPSLSSHNDFRKHKEFQASFIRLLEKILQDGNCIDPGYFSVLSDNLLFYLTINIYIINCMEFVLDFVTLSSLLLLTISRPLTSSQDEEVSDFQNLCYSPKSLSFSNFPYLFSFGIVNNIGLVIHEPNSAEIHVMNGKFVFGVNFQNDIHIMRLYGPVSISPSQIYECYMDSYADVKYYNNLIANISDVSDKCLGTVETNSKIFIQHVC